MKCSKCSYYSRPLLRCTLGKINPLTPTIKAGVGIIKLMGVSYFCDRDEECTARKQKLIEQARK